MTSSDLFSAQARLERQAEVIESAEKDLEIKREQIHESEQALKNLTAQGKIDEYQEKYSDYQSQIKSYSATLADTESRIKVYNADVETFRLLMSDMEGLVSEAKEYEEKSSRLKAEATAQTMSAGSPVELEKQPTDMQMPYQIPTQEEEEDIPAKFEKAVTYRDKANELKNIYDLYMMALNMGLIKEPDEMVKEDADFLLGTDSGYLDSQDVDYFAGLDTLEEIEARYLTLSISPDADGAPDNIQAVNRQYEMQKAFFENEGPDEKRTPHWHFIDNSTYTYTPDETLRSQVAQDLLPFGLNDHKSMQKAAEASLQGPLQGIASELNSCRLRGAENCGSTAAGFGELLTQYVQEIKGLSITNLSVDMVITDQDGVPWAEVENREDMGYDEINSRVLDSGFIGPLTPEQEMQQRLLQREEEGYGKPNAEEFSPDFSGLRESAELQSLLDNPTLENLVAFAERYPGMKTEDWAALFASLEEWWRRREEERKRKEKETEDYINKSFDFIIYGDYSEEFTWAGLLVNIGVGLIPVVGQIADIRDLIHALTHTGEKDLWGNIFSIGLGLVAFVPLAGDIKQIKHIDEFGAFAKHGNEVVDAAGELGKHGNEVVDAVGEVVEAGAKYGDDIVVDAFPKGVGRKTIKTTPAEEVNDWWKTEKGYSNPPYKAGSSVVEIELTEKSTFVRVFDGETSFRKGGWVMRAEDVKGMTPQQIKDLYALPSTPKYICDVELPAGTHLRMGTASEVAGWGKGGGVQFDLIGKNVGDFTNVKPLP